MANIPAKRNIPGIYLQTLDLSTTISPRVAINVAALLPSGMGQADKIIDVGSEDELVDAFGTPTSSNYEEWWNIARVWLYKVAGLGATVKVVRPIGAGSLNGTLAVSVNEVVANPTAQLIKNRDEASTVTVSFDADSLSVASRIKLFSAYPTDRTFKVALCSAADFDTANIITGVTFKDNFEYAPEGTEVAIAVLDENDNILEKWIVDLTPGNVDGFGQDTYLENVLNNKSKYIYGYVNDAETGTPVSFEATALKNGVYVAPTTADLATALDKFSNVETVDINYVIAHPDLHQETITLCETRQDCAFRAGVPVSLVVGVDQATALQNIENYAQTTLPNSTSYGSFGANALYIFDNYNNKTWWINPAGDLVGLRVQQNLSSQPWFSDAGLNYGQFREVIKLAQYWDSNDIKTIIENKMNPIILKPGKGIVKWGQRNYFQKPSAGC